jgi:hypothetical protein
MLDIITQKNINISSSDSMNTNNSDQKTRASSIRSRIQALGLEHYDSEEQQRTLPPKPVSPHSPHSPHSSSSNSTNTEVKKPPMRPPPRKPPTPQDSTDTAETKSTHATSFHEVQSKLQSDKPKTPNDNNSTSTTSAPYSNAVTQKRALNRPEPPPKGTSSKPPIPARPQPRNPSLARIPVHNQSYSAIPTSNADLSVGTEEKVRPMSAALSRLNSSLIIDYEPDQVKGAGEFVPYEPKAETSKTDNASTETPSTPTDKKQERDIVLDEQFRNKYRSPTQQQEEAAVVLQKYTRRWLAKKKFKGLKSRKFHREKCAGEILSTEKYYVECLKAIGEVYLEPMKQLANTKTNPKPPITREQISQIFSDIEVIINVNAAFLDDLQKRLTDYNANTIISDVFLGMAPFFKTYSRYCNNYDKSQNVLKDIKANPDMKGILAVCIFIVLFV